jgi:hypothetical protein
MQVAVLILGCLGLLIVFDSLTRLTANQAESAFAEEEEHAWRGNQLWSTGEGTMLTIGVSFQVPVQDLLRHVDVDTFKGETRHY